MRRTTFFLFSTLERDWASKTVFPHDRTGRFNLDEAAAELDLDPDYVASLYKPRHYTYFVKGQHYPAEQGRSGRPGSSGNSRGKMFPLYQRNARLNREMRELDWRRVTTE